MSTIQLIHNFEKLPRKCHTNDQIKINRTRKTPVEKKFKLNKIKVDCIVEKGQFEMQPLCQQVQLFVWHGYFSSLFEHIFKYMEY